MAKHSIMVIDDEKIVGDMAKLSLEQENYEVETFLNGESALERLKNKRFDVVVTDLKMKGVDGLEVLRTVKKLYPETNMDSLYDNDDHIGRTGSMYRNMCDNFFVPVLKLYDPAVADAYMKSRGFSLVSPCEYVLYDHADTNIAGQGTSLYYRLEQDKPVPESKPMFDHVDQMNGIEYKENYIRKTVEMMSRFLEKKETIDLYRQIETALKIYEVSQLYRLSGPVDAKEVHKKAQAFLSDVLTGE